MKTIQELIEAARKAIEEGKLDEAKQLTEQAKALKAIEELTPPPTPAKAGPPPPPTNGAGVAVTVVEDAADKALRERPFKGMGDFLMAVKDAGQGPHDNRLFPLRSGDPADEGGYNMTKALGPTFVGSLNQAADKAQRKAITGLGERVDSDGGVLVGLDRNTTLMERVYSVGSILQRIAIDPVGPNSNGMTYNLEDETSRADGSRRGGIRAYWMTEGGSYTASRPKFRQLELKLKKVGALVYATDEMLADAATLESYLMRNLPEELRFVIEDAVINGPGGGTPLGILACGALVSVTKETGQAAATVVSENIVKMWARRWLGASDYVWLVNQDVTPQLHMMSMAVGVGGVPTYMPPGGLSVAPYGAIFGRPVLEVEYCQTLGTVGDILLVSLSQVQGIDKGGVQSASSIHVNFTTGEQVFRFTYRIDLQPTWRTALTPAHGSNDVSPFIALATRS